MRYSYARYYSNRKPHCQRTAELCVFAILILMKKIIIAVVVIALIVLGYVGYTQGKFPFLNSSKDSATALPDNFEPTEVPTIASDSDQALAHEAWTVFQTYLGFLKKHDVAGVKTVTLELSSTCADKAKSVECNKLMDGAYKIGSTFKEADFTRLLSDSKQIILSTPFHTETSDLARASVRQAIYFARNEKGVPKVLSYTFPNEITYVIYDATESNDMAALDKRLTFRTNDKDLDGMPDEVEDCSFIGVDTTCKKTNPDNRDTDGDGWWDGVEPYIKS